MLQLLQQTASESDAEVIAATVHAVSSMDPFIDAVENNSSNYSMLAQAAAAALQAGNRCAKRLVSLLLVSALCHIYSRSPNMSYLCNMLR